MDTNTQPADPIIATTPEAPTDSWQENISKRFKAPDIPKVDYSKVDGPEAAPQGMEEIVEMDSSEFLKHLDQKESPVVEEQQEGKKTKEKKSFDDLSIDDLDLSKDPEPVEEKPKKKSKEDNIAELRKKAETYELEAKSKEEKLSEYQRKLEELEGELERTAFERSPKFKEKFQAPYETAVSNAVQFAKEIADDERIAEKALSLKGRERIEFIDESFGGGAAAAQFLTLINDADAKRGSLEAAMSDFRATSKTLVQEEENQRNQVNERIKRNFERVSNHLASKSDFFRKGDDEDANKIVDQRIKAAESILMGTASENDMMVAPFLAVIAKEAVSENEKLKAELAKYKNRAKADASVQPRINRSSSDEDSRNSKPKSALDSIRAQLRNY